MGEPTPTPVVRKPFWRDLTERVGTTFAFTFLALYIPPLMADGASVESLADLSVLSKAAVAAVAASLSVVKGVLAGQLGQEGSASLDPRV